MKVCTQTNVLVFTVPQDSLLPILLDFVSWCKKTVFFVFKKIKEEEEKYQSRWCWLKGQSCSDLMMWIFHFCLNIPLLPFSPGNPYRIFVLKKTLTTCPVLCNISNQSFYLLVNVPWYFERGRRAAWEGGKNSSNRFDLQGQNFFSKCQASRGAIILHYK